MLFLTVLFNYSAGVRGIYALLANIHNSNIPNAHILLAGGWRVSLAHQISPHK